MVALWTCNNTKSDASASTVVSMATIKIVGMPFIFSHVICAIGFPDPPLPLHAWIKLYSTCSCTVQLYTFTMLDCWLNYQQPCCWYLSDDSNQFMLYVHGVGCASHLHVVTRYVCNIMHSHRVTTYNTY